MAGTIHIARFTAAILLALLLAGMGSCGGGKGNGLLSLEQQGTESRASGNVRYMPPKNGFGLRQIIDYDYEYSSFPRTSGFSVVPMLDDNIPDPGKAQVFTTIVEEQGRNRLVKIDCQPQADSPRVHFRYDPALWQVDGVGVLNPYTEAEDYISFVRIQEAGLLEITTVPVGKDSSHRVNGRFAEIFVQPKGAERTTSTFEPLSGELGYTAAFFCQGENTPPTLLSYGNIDIRLDGEFGDADAAEKDGVLDDVPPEFPRWVYDACTHDVRLTNFGQTFGWNGSTDTFSTFAESDLSWSERLSGYRLYLKEPGDSDFEPVEFSLQPPPPPVSPEVQYFTVAHPANPESPSQLIWESSVSSLGISRYFPMVLILPPKHMTSSFTTTTENGSARSFRIRKVD